jgi:thiamine-monophosphate kinase
MMTESRTGAIVHLENVPMPSILKRNNLENLALAGGEDYQFLFTFPRRKLSTVESMISQGHPISIVGEVVKGNGVKVLVDGKPLEAAVKGYEHFGNTR